MGVTRVNMLLLTPPEGFDVMSDWPPHQSASLFINHDGFHASHESAHSSQYSIQGPQRSVGERGGGKEGHSDIALLASSPSVGASARPLGG